MKININLKYFGIIIGIIIIGFIIYQIYNYIRPIKTIFIKGKAFSFREDLREALKVETFPNENLFHELFSDYKTRNVTMLFKASTPKTNAIYQMETFEIVYKLSRYDDLTRSIFRPKKAFDAKEIDSYENITREDEVLKIILVPPDFSNQTKVTAGGNRIWIYGKTNKEFDFAVEKALLSMMNVTTLEGFV